MMPVDLLAGTLPPGMPWQSDHSLPPPQADDPCPVALSLRVYGKALGEVAGGRAWRARLPG